MRIKIKKEQPQNEKEVVHILQENPQQLLNGRLFNPYTGIA